MENDVRDTIQNENAPLVSISVIAYNHEKYIRQCLDGILMQNVNFPYEILIHDDASPDGTADIIREYEAKYPDIIKPIYQTENQFSKVGVGAISRFNDERARGKYIAQCEGDDYWTDPGKLQMQVDFLEAHPEYVGTAHNVRVVDEEGTLIHTYPTYKNHMFTSSDIMYRMTPGRTASLVYKNIFSNMSPEERNDYYACRGTADLKISTLLALNGQIYCFSKEMAAYRYVPSHGTSWSATMTKINRLDFYHGYCIDMYEIAKKYYNINLNFVAYHIIYICYSLLIYFRHPNDYNLDVAKKIIGTIINNKKLLKNILHYHIYSPIETMTVYLNFINKLQKINLDRHVII